MYDECIYFEILYLVCADNKNINTFYIFNISNYDK